MVGFPHDEEKKHCLGAISTGLNFTHTLESHTLTSERTSEWSMRLEGMSAGSLLNQTDA